jgi:hypothetical protein
MASNRLSKKIRLLLLVLLMVGCNKDGIDYSDIEKEMDERKFLFKVPSELPIAVKKIEMNKMNVASSADGYEITFHSNNEVKAQLTVFSKGEELYEISNDQFPVTESLVNVNGNKGIYGKNIIRWTEDGISYNLSFSPHDRFSISKEELIKIAESFIPH